MKNVPSCENINTCKNNNSENDDEESGCVWWINSPEHYNCLWLYIKDKSNPDGSMPELVQAEIAQLLSWSNTKTHFMLKQAMEELIVALKKNQANQLLPNDPDQVQEVQTYDLSPVVNYSSEESDE